MTSERQYPGNREQTNPSGNTDTPLWRFAVALWQRDEASECCLDLQQQGWSVTRLLCAGWLARQGHQYSGLEPPTLAQWRQDVTGPIRTIKKALGKSDGLLGPLRQKLAQAELEAERVELYRAWLAFRDLPATPTDTDPEILALANFRQAAPAEENRLDKATDRMIRKLAHLVISTSVLPASSPADQHDAHRSQP